MGIRDLSDAATVDPVSAVAAVSAALGTETAARIAADSAAATSASATYAAKTANLSDVANAATALTNLGGASAANVAKAGSHAVGTIDAPRRDQAFTYSSVLSSTVLYLTAFTPLADLAVTKIAFASGSTAAGATPTLVRFGLYTVSGTSITLVAATANDPTIFSSVTTIYERALSPGGSLPTTYTVTAGTRYAIGCLVVSSFAMPSLTGPNGATAVGMADPWTTAAYVAGADLPTSATPVLLSSRYPWGRVAA